MKDISVIIPTYKPGNYLLECLVSLENQTLAKEKYEIILILNGSDKTSEVYVKDCMNRLTNIDIELLVTATPGVSNARNLGLEFTSNKYVVFIDDDDMVSDNYLENILAKANNESLIVSNIKAFYEDRNDATKNYMSNAFNELIKADNLDLYSSRQLLNTVHSKLIPLYLIGDTRFNIKLNIGEDTLFIAQLSNKIKKLILTDTSTIYYRRIRANSLTNQKVNIRAYLLNKLILIGHFSLTYLKSPMTYNFKFFTSRILALSKKTFRDIIDKKIG